MIPQWIASTVVGLVAVAFAVNFCAQFVLDAWTPDPYVYGAFITITPLALGLRRDRATGSEERAS